MILFINQDLSLNDTDFQSLENKSIFQSIKFILGSGPEH
jgi:hypothetical protein